MATMAAKSRSSPPRISVMGAPRRDDSATVLRSRANFHDRDVTGNLERERRTLETWAQSYPRDPSPHTLLAGLALTSTGQHELAIAESL